MKHFREYLSESQKTYNYKIKIVGDVAPDFIKALEAKLKQFEPVKISRPKTSPVQAKPADFPKHSNDSVTSMDVEFRYPAIEPQITQIAKDLFMDPNRIIMMTVPYEESMAQEKSRIESENKDLLTDTDYPADTAEQKALKADYSAPYNEHAVLKNAYRSDFTVAGGPTPPAKTTNDLPMGVKSPMSKITRPAKPATGAQPQG